MVNGQWSVVNSSLANKSFISNYYICTAQDLGPIPQTPHLPLKENCRCNRVQGSPDRISEQMLQQVHQITCKFRNKVNKSVNCPAKINR